ncbi:Amino-acid carrier protein AlsT [Rosistilla carotiformis]|uniref:Amino-acid carrier protein AlsT n=1 Tax=Rosistilla carotiformis TaxID=2528017 RepID=A0A518K104_9BACT|nr:alanine/glycine:cation symporter family protein [Rosistilla carotiformis]QDV71476.1 Amino-acid carrier protein AlsT [Rosistilla carotiformis]
MSLIDHRFRLPVTTLLLALSLTGLAWGQDESATEVAAAEAAAAEFVEVDAEPEPAVVSKKAAWVVAVDTWFGEQLVGPLATLFFYDFGTGVPFVVAWLLVAGVFLTLRLMFINIRGFWHALRLTRGDYDDPADVGEVSHFQALATALSATVGLGNIGGVAVAIGIGGPGAAFWIFVVGFLGMSTKFAECTLGQLYRTTDSDGHTLGGPMRYLKAGLAEMRLGWLGIFLSTLFAILCIGASFGGGNAYQVSQSLSAIKTDVVFLQSYPWVYGLVMALAVGVVIIGGIQSIGRVASKIVPLMCFAYFAAALWILFQNVSALPDALALIVSSAFEPYAPLAGGAMAVLVMGIQRAVFSNEAGVGSAAIAHSAAKTNEPVSEGIVALLEPFIDTMVVCMVTALVLVVSGTYNPHIQDVDSPDRFAFVETHTPETVVASVLGSVDPDQPIETQVDAARARLAHMVEHKEGAGMTLVAFRSSGFHWFGYILFAAVVLFAFSTCISWSYYGERCWVGLFGTRSSVLYKLLFVSFTFLGSIVTATNILEFSDLMILGMSLPNLLGVFLLSGVVKRALDAYWRKYRCGSLERIL